MNTHSFEYFNHNADGSIFVGNHLILDLWGIRNNSFTDKEVLAAFSEACRDAGATVLSEHVHEFGEGCGTTGVIVLAESHLSWHHYPEVHYMAIDIFMCGNANPLLAVPKIESFLQPHEIATDKQLIRRGRLADPEKYVNTLKQNS